MTATILSLIGAVFSMVIGLWKFFGRKAQEKRARIDVADTQIQKGLQDASPAELISGIDALRNS